MFARRKPRSARGRAIALFAAAALVGAAGCGGAMGRGAGYGSPGTTTILVENHVHAPDTIDRLLIAVDGAALPLTALPPEGAPFAPLGALRLDPGAHTITVRVAARGKEGDTVVVAAERRFHVNDEAATIRLALRSREQPRAFEERLTIDLSMPGDVMELDVDAPPRDRAARCAPMQPVQRAMCRVAVRLDEATMQRDIVLSLCLRQKLGAMQRLHDEASSAAGEAKQMAEEQIMLLGRDADECIGEETLVPDGREVHGPSSRVEAVRLGDAR